MQKNNAMICNIVENTIIAKDTYKMLLFAAPVAEIVKPGQFIHIKIPNDNSMLLRRPFSVSNVFRESGIIEIIYRIVGRGTAALSNLKEGSMIDVLGPLGNGFKRIENMKKVFVVGGGCGIAPLKLLIKQWEDLDITSFLGFKSKEFTYDIDQFELLSNRLFVTTDDGSFGQAGLVTNVLKMELREDLPDMIISCGPTKMLSEIKKQAKKFNVKCQVSLEERMGCGVGGCLVCVCNVGTSERVEYKKVCIDGPVFWSEEVELDGTEYYC